MSLLSSSPNWALLLTPAAAHSEKSIIRELFKRLRKGDITSFAGGMPDTALFPYDNFKDAIAGIIDDQTVRVSALNYGPSEGYEPLREWIAAHLSALGAEMSTENILITTGGQQALDLTCRAMLSPGDKIAVTAPTYLGALQIIKSCSAGIISIQTDKDGPLLNEFEAAVSQGVKFVYLVSDFSNPTGLSISAERRKALIEIARLHRTPIIDDAAYQQLRFHGEEIPPLIALDQATAGASGSDPLAEGGVIHIGTFSKTMTPGLRVGWMAAPKAFLQAAVVLKQANDLHSPMLTQMATFNVVQDIYDTHIELLRETYGSKRDCMIAALRAHLPQNVSLTEPDGGMFVWLTLPEGSNAVELLGAAMDEAKVAYIPGGPFFATAKDGDRHCRLSFSGASQERIESGIERLGAFFSKRI